MLQQQCQTKSPAVQLLSKSELDGSNFVARHWCLSKIDAWLLEDHADKPPSSTSSSSSSQRPDPRRSPNSATIPLPSHRHQRQTSEIRVSVEIYVCFKAGCGTRPPMAAPAHPWRHPLIHGGTRPPYHPFSSPRLIRKRREGAN